jgi:hypothetical protein
MADVTQMSDADLLAAYNAAQPAAAPAAAPAADLSGMSDADLLAAYHGKPDEPKKETQWLPHSWDDLAADLKHQAGMAGRVVTSTIAGLPLMAEDAGVAARNLYSGATGGSYNQYTLPSTDFHRAQDQVFGVPQNTAEKVTDVVGPMVGGAAASKVPNAIAGAISGIPGPSGAAAQVPSNFMTPAQTKTQMLAQQVKNFQDKGFVIPPATSNPTLSNKMLEGWGGKIATQQDAALTNQQAANTIASRANGLNPDAPLTEGALRAVIKEAGKDYNLVDKAGVFQTGNQYLQRIADIQDEALAPGRSFVGSAESPIVKEADTLAQPAFDAKDARLKIRDLRDKASVAFRQGDGTLGTQYKALSKALEDELDRGAQASADPDLVARYRAARQKMAIANDTLDAMNTGSENIDIKALTRMVDKGEIPPSSPLATIGRFGAQFARAAAAPESKGSPGVEHLGTAMGPLIGALTGAEHGAGAGVLTGLTAGVGIPVSRNLARNYLLGAGQSRAVPGSADAIVGNGASSARAAALAQALAQIPRGQQP